MIYLTISFPFLLRLFSTFAFGEIKKIDPVITLTMPLIFEKATMNHVGTNSLLLR